MTLIETLTAMGAIAAFFILIISQIKNKNPKAFDWIGELLKSKSKLSEDDSMDKFYQIHPEKRKIM